ncbi:MAG: hypothetical protein J7M21_05935 [Planctomycetes bacterium]|nr:hypothetical protein [Planctomycetota bacterium]
MKKMSRPRSGGGFTLIEALMASVILAIAVIAVLMPFTAGARCQQDEMRRTTAVGLAQQLMEEILSKPFEEPDDGDDYAESPSDFGPEPGETSREDYSAIDDYDGYTEPAGAIVDGDGEVVTDPSAEGLSRRVSVQYVYVAGQKAGSEPTFMRVIVEVAWQGRPLVTLTRLVYWLDQGD